MCRWNRWHIMSAERILVVEDDKELLAILGETLQTRGYEVTCAASVSEAISATWSAAPDLILLDLTLLDTDPFAGLTDGFAFLHLLRRNHPEKEVEVIIHSGNDSPEIQERAQKAGVFAVLRKGCPIEELLGTVRLGLIQSQVAHTPA